MTKQRQVEIKLTNQILAAFVVILSLGLGYFIAKEQGWLKKPSLNANTVQRNYLEGEYAFKSNPYSLLPIEKTINSRRTRRQFQTTPITQVELAKLTWSLQGVTADWGGRTVPTIKSSYPLEVTIIVRNVEDLASGVYHFLPQENIIKKTHSEIPAYINQLGEKTPSLIDAPVVFIISGNQSKLSDVLNSDNTYHFLYLEAGHAAQNLFLLSESLGLGVNPITQFDQTLIHNALSLPIGETPIYILPVGHPQEV
jgi:SagB-type dehydrogenase family enzyme